MFLEDFDTRDLFSRFSHFFVLRYQPFVVACNSFILCCILHKPIFILKLMLCTMQWIDQFCGFCNYLSPIEGQIT